ncbi:MAG: regulatory protein RecX [candidate division WOR-3 bacterium]|nr:recombination regulator RecX [candidate division WOR-3 bacterium]MDW8151155.1 regulatory protein RecX [candidate division WOR-3 bacterium]
MNALSYAMKLLKFRSRSISEIRRRLSMKNFSNEEIEKTIRKLLNYGYINELQDAINYVEMKSSKGWSRRKIRYNLIKRGYKKGIIEKALKHYDKELVVQKLKRELNKKNIKKDKAIRLLKGRGFEAEIIKEVIFK